MYLTNNDTDMDFSFLNDMINLVPGSSSSGSVMISPETSTFLGEIDIPSRKITNETRNQSNTTYDIFEISSEVEDYINNDENISQKEQLQRVSRLITNVLVGYEPAFPKVRVILAEDNSITISWRVGIAYFGISIYQKEEESSWSLIIKDEQSRGYISDGYISDPGFNLLFPVMVELINKFKNC